MSIILDAIKRSKEAPQGSDGIPSLETEHFVASDDQLDRARTKKLILVALAGVIAFFSLGFLLFDGDKSLHENVLDPQTQRVGQGATSANDSGASSSVNAVEPSSATVAPKVVPTVGERERPSNDTQRSQQAVTGASRNDRPVFIKPESASINSSRPSAEELSSIYAAMNQERGALGDTAAISEGPSGSAQPSIENQSPAESEGLNQPNTEPAIDFAEILAQAQTELGVTPLVESSEPLLETLSQQIKDQIPSLIYSDHRYVADGRSEVVLNGQSLGERQRIGPFTVVEILPDSVILRWRETQFRVRALNSWINM
jgi:general secretion pathway protein B